MLQYYEKWLHHKGRTQYHTYWENNEPCVEVNFEIPLFYRPGDGSQVGSLMEKDNIDLIVYRGQIDKVATDEYDRLYLFEYKTAARLRDFHLDTDPQVTAYLWVAKILWPNEILGGMIYQQHSKNPPQLPRILSNGKLSVAKVQNTTSILYAEALRSLYGSIERAPRENKTFYNSLLTQETENRDKGVQWDLVTRNTAQLVAEQKKIGQELSEMLRTDLSLIHI